MLYGYPVEATAENWLHECLCEMLQAIHRSLDAGGLPPAWPEIIPADHRDKLQTRRGLQSRLDAYAVALSRLNKADGSQVARAMIEQNRIGDLLSGMQDCDTLDKLPSRIHLPLKDLFEFAFQNLLRDLGIRDRHYEAIDQRVRYPICPYCGCEYFDPPRAPREALDHYLADSIYPFAGVNLLNLTPMGDKCNAKYKLAVDILRRTDGTRRRSFNPYNAPGVSISLDESEPFAGADGQLPAWQISFSVLTEESETWESVFSIRQRYERDVLNRCFKDWLREFTAWCKSDRPSGISAKEDVVDKVERYAGFMGECGLNDRAFLKAAVFRMLLRRCREGNQRLIRFMEGLVTGAQATAQ